ncbi:benzoate 4-monooxygenase cytochrome P450 [Paracoccidioides lutzii Pb01]|uniref:Benzoate 4-monooxygenase cytochrome P450 n=1 Tax=Paracoccidioides lutzii (strain ATCC MYA-826 / Pb01) TaxID=502779 RepID=C1HE22_PARBA|nr:benzoate 4-monooxygenase cytochrome P450 [Paracoccidioides lutzii Pb01]EEH40562.2 benzoate 4-monooxygenase cytochrome P450 [Paracoccidioides lutzii Pb01]
MPMLLLLVSALAIGYLVVQRVHNWHRLRHITGPRSCAWTDIWMLRRSWSGSLYEDLGKLHQEHGPLVRIAPNYVICGDPNEVRRMWGVRSEWDRSPWYKGFQLDPPRDCTLSMRDNALHATLRSKLAPGYSGKGIESLHESIDAQIVKFIRLIESKYLSTDTNLRPVDFARKVQYLTLDVISTLAFGRTFGFLDKDGDMFNYIKTTEESLPVMQMIALLPWLVNVLQSRLFKAFMPSDTDMVGIGRVMGVAKAVVAERYGQHKITKPDLLGSFVANGLSQKEAEAESLVQIIAGSDTTATTLRTGILLLTTSPKVYTTLLAEIDTAISENRISNPVTDTEARALPYLQACIKECFRFWPPITGIMPRVCPREADVCGVRVPGGTNVGWSAWAVLRDKGVFGRDAEVFWPGRWLERECEGDRERLIGMERVVELVFGQGKWGCLGKPISLLEINKVFVELLRRFDFAVLNPAHPMETFGYGVSMQSGLYMRISRRMKTRNDIPDMNTQSS